MSLQDENAHTIQQIAFCRAILAKWHKKVRSTELWELPLILSDLTLEELPKETIFYKSEGWLDYRAVVVQRWSVLVITPVLAFKIHSPPFPALLRAQGD